MIGGGVLVQLDTRVYLLSSVTRGKTQTKTLFNQFNLEVSDILVIYSPKNTGDSPIWHSPLHSMDASARSRLQMY